MAPPLQCPVRVASPPWPDGTADPLPGAGSSPRWCAAATGRRTAALQAEVVALRGDGHRAARRAGRRTGSAAAVPAAGSPLAEPGWVTLRMPLVRLALGDPDDVAAGPDVAAALASPDRGPDTAETEIVLRARPDRRPTKLAWTVLAAPAGAPAARPADRPRRRAAATRAADGRPPSRRRSRPPEPPSATRLTALVDVARRSTADAATCRCRRRRRTSSRGSRPCRRPARPGSSSVSTCMLLNDADRSFSRHGVFSPRDTR